jgi:chromate transporter
MSEDPLGPLALRFALLSLLAVGGLQSVVPEMHRFTVEAHGWLTDQEFAALYALGQAAPGPNMLAATLIGWRLGGLAGALAATLAMAGPPCLLAFFALRVWDRFRDAPWRRRLQAGLAPVTVGLIAAGALVVTQAADRTVTAFALTAATAAWAYWSRRNPLWLLGLGALLGAAGFV